jgi:hypothetical protein
MISIKPVSWNPSFSIGYLLDINSNLTEESDLHSEKHFSLKTSTDEAPMISIKRLLWNASFSIRDNLDPDSNVTEESDLHAEKYPSTSS